MVVYTRAVLRIIEESDEAAALKEAVLQADLVLAPELMLTEAKNAL